MGIRSQWWTRFTEHQTNCSTSLETQARTQGLQKLIHFLLAVMTANLTLESAIASLKLLRDLIAAETSLQLSAKLPVGARCTPEPADWYKQDFSDTQEHEWSHRRKLHKTVLILQKNSPLGSCHHSCSSAPNAGLKCSFQEQRGR